MKNAALIFLAMVCAGELNAQEPVGWASENGGTTGGDGGETVTVTSASDLVKYAAGSQPRTIKISGTITANRIDVGSNKTIEGAEEGATLDGSFVLNGNSGARKKNVIIRNLIIRKTQGSHEDIITMQYIDNVWIDHCAISDHRNNLDGLCDMTHAVNFVTVSWTKFSYPSSAPEHRFCMLISHSDNNEAEDLGKLKITLHHNWFAENIRERMPRMRFCQVHSFNNYFSSEGNNYCIGAGKKAQVLVESNCFENVNRPHFFYSDEPTAVIALNDDNYYDNTGGDRDEGQGTCFVPPYEYALDQGITVKRIVTDNVGPQFSEVAIINDRSIGRQSDLKYRQTGESALSHRFTLTGQLIENQRINSAGQQLRPLIIKERKQARLQVSGN